MWEKVWGYIMQTVSVNQRTEKNTDSITNIAAELKEMRLDDKDFNQRLNYMALALQKIDIRPLA